MIILKHLTIERFRLLHALNLHFPQRGSILIQGPNEAGKSALVESIYFALYGEPLLGKRGRRSLDDLIFYGSSDARVVLTLSVGATELEISRTLRRGQPLEASLVVSPLGMPSEEPITDLFTVNERIIAELGGMNAETLKNSGLIEQKRLNRLEAISGTEREATMRKLLGLESFLALAQQFRVTEPDELALQEATERLRLAEFQSRIPEVSKRLEQIELALDAVQINDYLAAIDQQESEISELEVALDEIESRRLELKSRLSRVQYLKKADATLDKIITAYDEIAEAQNELPRLELEIADLERAEREELPRLEKRVSDLGELTRSFGTLQRMSGDLLAAVDSIKALEQELKEHNELKQDLRGLEAQVIQARARLSDAQQSWHELDEQRRTFRPQLEARMQRLYIVSERLDKLKQLEDLYVLRLSKRELVESNSKQLQKVLAELRDTEQEQSLVEHEARQVQQQADALEQSWRQLSIRRQLEEWYRLKGLSQGLIEAEQHVNQARLQQAQLTKVVLNTRASVMRAMLTTIVCVTLCLLFLLIALLSLSVAPLAGLLFVLAAGLALASVILFRRYRSLHEQELEGRKQEQDAISRVGMMVAARETAMRMAGNDDGLYKVENEIRSLGGSIPQTLAEAQVILEGRNGQGDLGDVQQRMKARIDEANAARNQVNVTMEAVAALRKERTRLEDQRKREQLDHFEELLASDRSSIEKAQQEVFRLASQEGLPQPSINARLQMNRLIIDPCATDTSAVDAIDEELSGIPSLESMVESTIKATEHEISSLDVKLDLTNELATQARMHQETLEGLLDYQRALEERIIPYEQDNPQERMEKAREQQISLQSALQSLRDSLRQRVKPLGVTFLQSAVSSAENEARKQLEEMHFNLGNRVMLQERHTHYTAVLSERQESLSEYYKQLAKFSNTLGSWIVPLNPFAEALVALRNRCQTELIDANEMGVLQEIEILQVREGASNMRIELCQQDIETMKEQITQLLVKRNRPQSQGYASSALITVWPLVGEYSVDDRESLEEQQTSLEDELEYLEREELSLSQKLETGTAKINLAGAHMHLERQERSYLTKKHGNRLINAVNERLLAKVLPHTEHYMQQILPLLTGHRYHDVHLTTETEDGTASGGPIQVLVWDTSAGEYLPTSALSGGAADQISLALRLAFAIATLPRELSAAPGFVILDEPLSSFDRGRAQALVNVVTGDILSQHFEQIILISHSSAFDPAMFPYHLYMDNGLVVESNFPVISQVNSILPSGDEAIPETPQPEVLVSEHDDNDEDEQDDFASIEIIDDLEDEDEQDVHSEVESSPSDAIVSAHD